MSTDGTPRFAPTRVGPNTLAEPTAEHRAAFAAYLRGLADAVENPDRLGLPIRIGQVVTEVNQQGPQALTLNAFDPFGNDKIGQQVKDHDRLGHAEVRLGVVMTDDIVTFIRARLDEDERDARAGFSGQVDTENGWGEIGSAVTPHVGVIHEDIQRAHVVKWNPARVLRGVEAKRKALALHAQGHECPSEAEEPNVASWYESDCPTLRAVACEWSTHPDFRPEWTL